MNWLKAKIKEFFEFLWNLVYGLFMNLVAFVYVSILQIGLAILVIGGYIAYILCVLLQHPTFGDPLTWLSYTKVFCLFFPLIAIPWGWIAFFLNDKFSGWIWDALSSFGLW